MIFAMPALGESVTTGTITRWLKPSGEPVRQGEPLLEVATDKVDTEIEAPFHSTIRELLAQENDTIEVGDPLAILEPSAGAAPPPAAQAASVAAPPVPTDTPPIPAAPPPAAELASSTASGSRTEKLTGLRQTIARRTVESLQVAAQLMTVAEADVTRIAALRARHKKGFLARTGVKLTFLPFVAKAAVEALATHPVLKRLGQHGQHGQHRSHLSRRAAPRDRGRRATGADGSGHQGRGAVRHRGSRSCDRR